MLFLKFLSFNSSSSKFLPFKALRFNFPSAIICNVVFALSITFGKSGIRSNISFDISNKALNMSFSELKNISDNLDIDMIQGDFFNDLQNIEKSDNNRMYLFLGSTIGNFNNDLAVKFLTNISKVMNNKLCRHCLISHKL